MYTKNHLIKFLNNNLSKFSDFEDLIIDIDNLRIEKDGKNYGFATIVPIDDGERIYLPKRQTHKRCWIVVLEWYIYWKKIPY